jgi:hypothetical protein
VDLKLSSIGVFLLAVGVVTDRKGVTKNYTRSVFSPHRFLPNAVKN